MPTSMDAGVATIVRHHERAASAVQEVVDASKGQEVPSFGSELVMKARGGIKRFRPWYKRWVVVDEGGVSWYPKEPKSTEETKTQLRGRVPLHQMVNVEAMPVKGPTRFTITHKLPRGGGKEVSHFRAETPALMRRWLELISRRLNEHAGDFAIGFGAVAAPQQSLAVDVSDGNGGAATSAAAAATAAAGVGGPPPSGARKITVGQTNYRPAGISSGSAGAPAGASTRMSVAQDPNAQIGDSVERRLTAIAGNSVCADCATSDKHKFPSQPTWGSTNLGVVFCIRCSGVHRKIGAHITKVLSLQIDAWSEEMLLHMETLGNAKVNAELEAQVPPGVKKPDPATSSGAELEAYIRAKYELGSFKVGGDGRLPEVAKSKDATKAMDAFCGLLIVRLLRGTDLPNLDLLSKTDPFVEFQLGERKQKSKTKRNELNPVWNETLSLNVRSLSETLIVKVFDEDRFSNTFVGQAVVPLDDLTHDGEPMGFHLTLTGGKCVEGQSHIAVELTYNPLGN